MSRAIALIDRVSDVIGRLIAWLILPLVGGLTWEVIARYVFHAPTIWAYDLTYMLYGSHFMLGAGYALLRGAHIRTDFLYERYSDRTKGIIDTIAYLGFFFPGMLFFFLSSLDEALHAWRIREMSEQTAWRPPIWPFKMAVPVAAALLLVQGVAELLKSLYAIRTGHLYQRREAVEV